MSADLDKGFDALDAGDLEAAAAAAERAQRIDRKNPGVIALSAAVADAQGNVEDAIAGYRAMIELAPDDPMPRICAARIELRDLGEAEQALETVGAAFEFIDDETDLIEAIVVRAEALLATDRPDDAREALGELSSSAIDDPDQAFELAELALGAGDAEMALRYVELARKSPKLETDALHVLGRIHEANDDRAEMIAAWQQVRERDAAEPAPTLTMADDEIERIAQAALAELPADVRAKLERVPILIDAAPSQELVADGLDPRILGLFSGAEMAEAEGLAPEITTIHLFKRNLERIANDLDELAEEIRITVLHETAHYFGLDDDDLEKIGLD
ncbi:MAG TPA: metallopeptidase family protein [Kofleriaceae bacterium]|jgi:predicted Zn-dependent protease with MMP-like domain